MGAATTGSDKRLIRSDPVMGRMFGLKLRVKAVGSKIHRSKFNVVCLSHHQRTAIPIFASVYHQLKHYLIHRWKSVHLHGIHSPFVFAFQHDCLQDKRDDAAYLRLVRFRESVTNNPQLLHIEDHGAGSKRLHVSTRTTTDILRNNCSSPDRTKILYRIARYFNAQRVLELGTSLGIGTSALAMGSTTVTSVEGSPAVHAYAQQQLNRSEFYNIELVLGKFQDYFDGKLTNKPSGKYDLVFIDGHHNGDATIRYFEQLLPYCGDHTVIIIDDIHWSASMTAAWHILTHHKAVTASVNTFQWGILFLRKEQRQQSFYVRL